MADKRDRNSKPLNEGASKGNTRRTTSTVRQAPPPPPPKPKPQTKK